MSISVTKIVSLQQAALKFLVGDESEGEDSQECKKTIGGLLSDSGYGWLSNGPRLEIIHTKTGCKIGAWTFGWVLKDVKTEVVCVDEIQRPHGRLPLLAVGINCDFSGGMICIFDFVTSKVIRAINIRNKISNLHVIDSGYDIFTLPGPLRNFDGVIALGTAGGDVYLIDICRQICDEALTTGGLSEIRDELNPSELSTITSRQLSGIEHHKEYAVRNSQHLAIHLNVVLDKSTKHFTLKGPKGDDRIHVNKEEVAVSALYYCSQLGSLLVGYNFGALQLYNLMDLKLVYTSPVCDEHLPISHFAIQEPADDPRSVCYIWAVYSSDQEYPNSLPLGVMYAFCYHTKEYHEGYGFLYQDFSNAAVQYQMELGLPEGHRKPAKIRGGRCLKLNSIALGAINREEPSHESNEDILTLSVFVWNVLFSNRETQTFVAVFDLNQWYKEQMPSVPNVQYSSTYMIQIYLNDLINSATNRPVPVLYAHVDKKSVHQFTGPQRLEEHFYPNSLSFSLTCLRENDIVFLHNYGVQKALLAQIESSGPLCLIEPAEIHREVIGLGLLPLFIDLPVNAPISTNQQREIILGAALENQLIGWLCKCASEWANGSFLSTGCSLDLLISWAFQRAAVLKTNCDKFCVSLFDYSQVRLDNNTNILLNNCTRQLKNVYSLYTYIIEKLPTYISNHELVAEQYKSLQTVSVYFEVLQWLLNVGLLPECPLTSYPRSDDLERISAPYPAEMLTDFYNHRRALLKILNEENFSSSESVLFIDALIERGCKGKTLQEQWRDDDGNGLYPPPSLQALLRTYLIDNVDLAYKHSVVIYVFLDLAMTLDQERYKPVITHLIKFPAVFKVSPSMIKITQAFWQLDHCDYNTAMGLLLDPLISSEDLKPWHHKIVLRSLVLQKQYNFALLYVKVRKPILEDDEDILSAISLYVANNMLDEAFYFCKNYANRKEEHKFLTHLFDECNKNNKLRSLIYRTLTSSDEKFFLQYLSNSKDEELRVYYHILRSHFFEAFETHGRTVINDMETQGLRGQENAIPREKLIHSLKKLLPEVNRNLLNYCHKEKTNVWQQVTRPTPMSVFVHNMTENVQYKSTVIGAALAKARQTFNETVDQKSKLGTEETPFLRTPTPSVSSRRSSAVVITPRIINVDEDSPPSAKRLKLSPKVKTPLPSKLDTPLVKRKTPKRDVSEDRRVDTPQSILKVKNFIDHTPVKSGQFEDDFKEFKKLEYTPVTPKKSGLGLSPRKSLPVVRFEGLQSLSSNSLDNTRTELRSAESSKSTSAEDDVFYSPDASLEERPKEEEEVEARENISEETPPTPVSSPKGRRSYKRSLGETTPVRSSPRLAKLQEMPTQDVKPPPEKEPAVELSPLLPKLRPRKSLCRKVLESNTLNRVLLDSPDKVLPSVTQVEQSTEKIVLESSTKYEDGEEIHKSSLVTTHSLTKSLVETDLDTSEDFSIEYAVEDGPELSDSMLKYINKPNKTLEDTDKEDEADLSCVSNGILDDENEDEVMEVDDDVEEVIEDGQLVYQTLTTSVIETEKEEVKETFDGETTTNRPVDPEMNVFEVSDDLNYNNDGLMIEKEVELEEDDLCYDQQNTLESVLEENMVTVSSTGLNVFEENVFNESSGSENEENCLEEKVNEDEVIEIGSSSEEEGRRSNSSEYEEEEHVSHGKNIYDSEDDYSSQSDHYVRHYSEISENSEDDDDDDGSEQGCGLFQGDIIAVDEEDENGGKGLAVEDSDKSSNEDEVFENRSAEKIIEDVEVQEISDAIGKEVQEISRNEDEDEEVIGKEHSTQPKEDESVEVQEISKNEDEDEGVIRKEHSTQPEEDESVEVQEISRNEDDDKEVIGKEHSTQPEEDESLEIREISTNEDENKVVEKEIEEELRTQPEDIQETSGNEDENKDGIVKLKVDKNKEEIQKEDSVLESLVEDVSVDMEELQYSAADDDIKDKNDESYEVMNATKRDPLDFVDDAPSKFKPIEGEPDVIDQLLPLDQSAVDLRSSSVSSANTARVSTRRTVDVLVKLNMNTPKQEPDVIEDLLRTERPVRTLRSRRVSTEETPAPTVTLRKRSASVDETMVPVKKTKKEVDSENKKLKNRRASSVSQLPKIPEHEEAKTKKAKSVLEGYSMNRRLTRQQVSLLKKVDPIILLDRLPFDGTPDPEEQKVYDSTPSPSNSSSGSPVKGGRRLRSASQASENSRRSKSKTPTRVVKKKSADEDSKKTTSSARKKLTEIMETVDEDSKKTTSSARKKLTEIMETTDEPQTRITRSRTKSMSSVNSDDSNVSASVRKQRVASQSKLPEIKEEPTKEKAAVPKRRTRKNSFQM